MSTHISLSLLPLISALFGGFVSFLVATTWYENKAVIVPVWTFSIFFHVYTFLYFTRATTVMRLPPFISSQDYLNR